MRATSNNRASVGEIVESTHQMATTKRKTPNSFRFVLRRVRLAVLIVPIVISSVPVLLGVKQPHVAYPSQGLSNAKKWSIGQNNNNINKSISYNNNNYGNNNRKINNNDNGKWDMLVSTRSSEIIDTTLQTPSEVTHGKFLFIKFSCKIKPTLNSTTKQATDYRHYFDYNENEVERDESYDFDVDANAENGGQFPPDFFSLKMRQNGAVLFHIFGLVYMFIALAIVCDEFFVPSLTVITETLDISEDVAGATFMAAGGSAPEFFTSVIGVFIAQNNVGIGTIVGSATFNILFVLAFCTLFSTTILYLTWWPLFRDVFFYIISLLMLILFFVDEQIEWWEALSLFLVYICYCLFMKYNESLETWTKSKLCRDKSVSSVSENIEQQMPIMPRPSQEFKNLNFDQLVSTDLDGNVPKSVGYNIHESVQRCESLTSSVKKRNYSLATGMSQRRQSIPILHSGAMFRNGIIQLMSQTLEPLAEKDGNETSECDTTSVSSSRHNNTNNVNNNNVSRYLPNRTTLVEDRRTNADQTASVRRAAFKKEHSILNGRATSIAEPARVSERRFTKADIEQLKSILEEEEEKPLGMSWPDSWHKRAIYVFLSPILFPLWVTLPDVRKESCRGWFIFTFCGSIFWIACFSYVMVWFANTIGETFVIPTEVIGLTILAAGTSIPDLITSVIVARKGLGDMAVSSSVGSNIFDVCVGLPIPWLLYFGLHLFQSTAAEPIPVSSNGLLCSVGMLFFMLVVLLTAIALSHWRMNKVFGVVMIISYAVFCVISVKLETGHFQCPLRIC